MVGGVTPGKGGSKHLGLPVFDTVPMRSRRPAPTPGDLRAAAVRGRRDPRSGRRRHPLIVCITEGIPVLDMVRVKRALQAGRRAPDRAELPGHHHAGRMQDRHHAGPHPQAGQGRHRVALRHADLRSGVPDHQRRPRPEHLHRHRRRSGQRHQLRRRAELFQAIRRPKASSWSARSAAAPRKTPAEFIKQVRDQAGGRLHRRRHRAPRASAWAMPAPSSRAARAPPPTSSPRWKGGRAHREVAGRSRPAST
jgi:hypothetical protein